MHCMPIMCTFSISRPVRVCLVHADLYDGTFSTRRPIRFTLVIIHALTMIPIDNHDTGYRRKLLGIKPLFVYQETNLISIYFDLYFIDAIVQSNLHRV